MREFSEQLEIEAPPATIFQIYREVANWKDWDRTIEYAQLDKFETGGHGVLKSIRGPKSRMTIADVTPDKSFTATFTLPLCELRLEYLLTPVGAGRALVTHRVVFDGMLAPVFG